MKWALGKLGEMLAVLVYSYVESGNYEVAAWVERKLLNPVQRRLGANVSNYATSTEKK